MVAKEDKEDTVVKISIKKIGAIMALVGTLVGGIVGIAGWYSAEIEADTAAKIEHIDTVERVERLEGITKRHDEAMQLNTIRGIRTETMMETLLEEKGLPVPPKTKQQKDIEEKLLSGTN